VPHKHSFPFPSNALSLQFNYVGYFSALKPVMQAWRHFMFGCKDVYGCFLYMVAINCAILRALVFLPDQRQDESFFDWRSIVKCRHLLSFSFLRPLDAFALSAHCSQPAPALKPLVLNSKFAALS
jgi:hypothetical protein